MRRIDPFSSGPLGITSVEVAREAVCEELLDPCPRWSKRTSNTKDNTQYKKTDADTSVDGFCKQLAPAAPEACPTTYRPMLRSRSNPERAMLAALPCRRWTCTACAARMAYRLGAHYLDCLAESGEGYWRWSVPACNWGTVQKRLARAHASYLWIAFDGVRRILSTEHVKGGVRLSTVEACRTLTDWFLALPVRDKPAQRLRVTDSSNDWAPPSRLTGESWKFFGRVRCKEPAPLVAFLASHGIKADVQTTIGGFVVRFRLPDGIDESEATALIARLRTVR